MDLAWSSVAAEDPTGSRGEEVSEQNSVQHCAAGEADGSFGKLQCGVDGRKI